MSNAIEPVIVNGVCYVGKAVDPNGCDGCAGNEHPDRDTRRAVCAVGSRQGGCYENSLIFVEKEEPMTEQNQKVAGPEHEVALQQTLGLPIPASIQPPPYGSAYVVARQEAWSKYQDSRARTTGYRPATGLNSHIGFEAGFEAAWSALQPTIAGLRTASEVKPAPRKGKLVDLIVTSLRQEGPASAHTLAVRLGRQLNSVSPRTITLKNHGNIVVVGSEPATNGRGVREVYAAATY